MRSSRREHALGVGDLDPRGGPRCRTPRPGSPRRPCRARARRTRAAARPCAPARTAGRLDAHRLARSGLDRAPARAVRCVPPPHGGRDLVGEALEVGLGQPVDVPEVGRVARHDADRRAGLLARSARARHGDRRAPARSRAPLDVEVGEVTARRSARSTSRPASSTGISRGSVSGTARLLLRSSPSSSRASASSRSASGEPSSSTPRLAVVDPHPHARTAHLRRRRIAAATSSA